MSHTAVTSVALLLQPKPLLKAKTLKQQQQQSFRPARPPPPCLSERIFAPQGWNQTNSSKNSQSRQGIKAQVRAVGSELHSTKKRLPEHLGCRGAQPVGRIGWQSLSCQMKGEMKTGPAPLDAGHGSICTGPGGPGRGEGFWEIRVGAGLEGTLPAHLGSPLQAAGTSPNSLTCAAASHGASPAPGQSGPGSPHP